MRVLGLCSYPIEAAATRYRLVQFVQPLAEQGIELVVSPFLSSELFAVQYSAGSGLKKVRMLAGAVLKRIAELRSARGFDALLVQREAMIFGPAFFERLFRIIGQVPMILDLDDATFLPYTSPTYGRLISLLKFFGKTDKLIRNSAVVICGNEFIANYVVSMGAKSVIIPTVVDTDVFTPIERSNQKTVLGWIGTHSTFPMLESIFPALNKLAETESFVLRIVGSGRTSIEGARFEIENLPWNLDREVTDFQTLDIGLYPIVRAPNAPIEWVLGKSGFKAIQYLSVGVPFVMSPVGVCAELGVVNHTHFLAESTEDWHPALSKLVASHELRRQMGEHGRQFALEHFTVGKQALLLSTVLQDVVNRG